jgi:glutathione S-transferase
MSVPRVKEPQIRFTLYNYVLSGNCYKVRLLASLLNVEYESIAIDFHPGRQHKSEALLRMNPAGTLPILVQGDTIFTETSAMLVWMAQTYDVSKRWWPIKDDAQIATIVQWLGFSSRLSASIGELRQHSMLHKPIDVLLCTANAQRDLRELESHLTEQLLKNRDWLAGNVPTIADIACFPYTALAPDAGIEHDDFPAIRQWLHKLKCLEGFVTMPGIYELHEKHQTAGVQT